MYLYAFSVSNYPFPILGLETVVFNQFLVWDRPFPTFHFHLWGWKWTFPLFANNIENKSVPKWTEIGSQSPN